MIVETIEEALAAAEVQLENRLINLLYPISRTFLEVYISMSFNPGYISFCPHKTLYYGLSLSP